MTPYEELQAGNPLGPATYSLLVAVTLQSTSSYPPPAGYTRWSEDAAKEWLHEYFLPTKGVEVALRFTNTAVDDASLVRVARKAVRNALIDAARATTTGRMVGRLSTLLPRHGFTKAKTIYAGQRSWTLDDLGDAIFLGDWKDLLRSPQLKGISPIIELNSQGPTSRANTESLIEAVRGLLLAAQGAMRERDLANAVVELFELDDPTLVAFRDPDEIPASDELDGEPPEDDEPSHDDMSLGLTAAGVDQLVARDDADRIWSSLTEDEQVLVGFVEQPVAVWSEVLPDRTGVIKLGSQLLEKLRQLFDADPPAPGALKIVHARSVRLPPRVATSVQDDR